MATETETIFQAGVTAGTDHRAEGGYIADLGDPGVLQELALEQGLDLTTRDEVRAFVQGIRHAFSL